MKEEEKDQPSAPWTSGPPRRPDALDEGRQSLHPLHLHQPQWARWSHQLSHLTIGTSCGLVEEHAAPSLGAGGGDGGGGGAGCGGGGSGGGGIGGGGSEGVGDGGGSGAGEVGTGGIVGGVALDNW